MKPTLILATRNPGKMHEMRALLADLPIELRGADSIADLPPVAETGTSYRENAILKACSVASWTGIWTLGDDTGLEVEALDGAPGLRSSRLVGSSGSDQDRREKLLELLADYPRPWRARFVCVVALCSPDGETDLSEGECPGEIIPVPQGIGGFGYDQIFRVDGGKQTMAELTLDRKNLISHRGLAVQALRPTIMARLGIPPESD